MLRDYQIELARKAYEILSKLMIVYLAIEMRVGKTLIALKTAEMIGAKNVLFLTKKKAIHSILNDYRNEGFAFNFICTNYEQAGKLSSIYDVVIVDESHSNGALGKPSLRTKEMKRLVGSNYLIMLSGTPSPETYSQLYHQFWISDFTPFKESTFYKWAHEYVIIKQKIFNGLRINDYSHAMKDKIMAVLQPYFLTYTQDQAGFTQNEIIEEKILVDQDPRVQQLINKLLKDRYHIFKDGRELVCDTPVKLQTKVHQLSSGTVKFDDGSAVILDASKAKYISQHYQGKKIAVYYKFIAEGYALKKYLPNYTEDPEEFNSSSNKTFLSQIASGSMGINLATADVLIFYNIDFSSVQYWQARARLQDLNRGRASLVHWLFSKDGIEEKIYDVVLKKRDFTTYYFKKFYLSDEQHNEKGHPGKRNSEKDHRLVRVDRSIRN